MSFAAVEFLNNNDLETHNEVAVVPSKWIVDRQCYWPNRIGKTKFEDFIKELPSFKSTWTKYNINKILFRTDDYEAADNFITNFLDENSSSMSNKSVRKEMLEEDSFDDHLDDALLNVRPCPDEMGVSFSPITRPSSTTSSSNRTFNSSPSGMEKIILDEICRLNVLINQQSTMLGELLRNSRAQMMTDTSNIGPSDLPNFPLKTVEEFDNFNNKLTDEHTRKYMISRLCAVGGSGIEGLTRRIMKFLVTDQLASKFNWKGRGDKISFEKCPLASVVIEAAKRNFPEEEKNDLLIADTIKLWLKYAPSRIAKGKI